MKNILLPLLVSFSLSAFAQNDPQEVTPAIQKKIRAEIDKAAIKLKTELKAGEKTPLQIEFSVDTFRVEKYFEEYMTYDYTTAGMVTAGYEAAHAYDSLLNKYYKKLLSKLKATDRPVLIQAQKAWVAFRDAEEKLITTVSDDGYTGGGTVQHLVNVSQYLELIKRRAIGIFEYLDRLSDQF